MKTLLHENIATLFGSASLALMFGTLLFKWAWQKNKMVLAAGFYLSSSKYRRRQWQQSKEEFTRLVRFYYLCMLFSIALITYSIWAINQLISIA